MKMNKKGIKIAGTMALCFMVLAGYAAIAADDTPRAKKNNGQEWMNVTLEDVTTGEKFTISDFNGKVVVLETFAVWCPTCTKQQKEIKKLHGKAAGVISITVDIDPNESADKVRSHVERYGFDWPHVGISRKPVLDLSPGASDTAGSGVRDTPLPGLYRLSI